MSEVFWRDPGKEKHHLVGSIEDAGETLIIHKRWSRRWQSWQYEIERQSEMSFKVKLGLYKFRK